MPKPLLPRIDRNYRAPKLKLPPGACDTHFHFIGPQKLFPLNVHTLVERYPNRLLWGSDWPHPRYFKPLPKDVDLLDQMLDWVPEESARKRIFVDNPAECLGFPPPAG
jgi:predicted TIM-barrel fold metal-dependent hydrolase